MYKSLFLPNYFHVVILTTILSISCDSELEVDTSFNKNLDENKTELNAKDVGIPDQHYDEILAKINPDLICDDVIIEFTATQTLSGKKDCSNTLPQCTDDGQSECLVSGDFKAAYTDKIANKILAGTIIGGITGTLQPSPELCSSDGQSDCINSGNFKSVNISGISSVILTGNAVAGVSGTYSPDFPDISNVRTNDTVDGIAGTYTPDFPEASNVRATDTVNGISGNLLDCSADGALSCVSSSAYPSANIVNATAGNIKSGVTIAGVSGTYGGGALSDCSSDGELGCKTVASYRAVDMSNVTAGTVKSGTTIAGVSGDYPSSTYPLSGASATADLTASGFNTSLALASSFEYWTSDGSRQTGAGDADLTASNIKDSIAMFGVTGSVTESPSNCSSDGGTGCVAVTAFKAADMTNVTAGTVKSGTTIAGVAGDYPSATYPLNGASATADLSSAGFNTSLASASSFEYWTSVGTRQSGAGDTDLATNNIKDSIAMFGITGSVTESPTNCSSDGEINCVAVTAFKATDISNITAGTVKSGTTIAGVVGDYPSATFPLSGATATADLTLFTTQLNTDGSFEYWDSQGTRRTGSGDSDILASNVSTGVSFENLSVSGALTPIETLPFKKVYTGNQGSCALTSEGQAYCWGPGSLGEIGNGADNDQHTPTAVSGGHTFKSLEMGVNTVCGLTSEGKAYCWGRGQNGRLGNGGTSNQNVPTLVSGGHTFITLGGGSDNTCGITNSGQTYCWGYNGNGKLGNGNNSQQLTPALVSGGHVFTDISSGSNHSCAITSTGESYCW